MPSIKLSQSDKQTLLVLAYDSIRHGLLHNKPLPVKTENFSEPLQQTAASFVTLHKHGELRGCIGTLEARQPLANDVVEHAYAAAFQDSRFPALDPAELDQLDIEISVLTQPIALHFSSEADLLQQIRPGIDGLILESGFNRGTFLPSVWEQLPDAKMFLDHLKLKAGLPTDWWRDDVKISRYETLSFS